MYLPILKQGGGSNTIAVVNGVRAALEHLLDVPKSLAANVVFDQSVFVKTAIRNLSSEGGIGLVLTGLMILIFLGSTRATFAVMLSIPLSALAAFLVMSLMGETINSMVLGGLALAFSRLIDNSVVVLENIFRHLEMGKSPQEAAEVGAQEVALPVLAATFTTAIVFFPVVFLYGVSRFLFVALALSVVLSLFASFFVAFTVVPLFCAKFIKNAHHEVGHHKGGNPFQRFVRWFNRRYDRSLMHYDRAVGKTLLRPVATTLGVLGIFLFSLGLYPLLGLSFFPRTDPGQFVINVKAPSGTRIELTDQYIARVEQDIRDVVPASDLNMIVSNIGTAPGFSAIYSSNSGPHTAFVQVSLKDGHRKSSFDDIAAVRAKLRDDLPELSTYFQTGGLVDAVVNLGLPAPIDIQVGGSNLNEAAAAAKELSDKIRKVPGVGDVLTPQDMDFPGLRVNVNREMAGRLGLTSREVVDNVITSLDSNSMIAPSYWDDPRNGNSYILAVQYPEQQVQSLNDLQEIPLHARDGKAGDDTWRRDKYRTYQYTDGGRPLSAAKGDRCLCLSVRQGSGRLGYTRAKGHRPDEAACESHRECTRLRRGDAQVLYEFRHRAHPFDRAGVPDSDGAVLVVHRSAHHPSGDSPWDYRRHSVSAGDGDDLERDVADGRDHDDRNRCLEFDSYR